MFIIWRGWGILAFAFAGIGYIAGLFIDDAVGGTKAVGGHPWFAFAGLALGALATWYVGTRLNSRPGRILVDPATGQQVELRSRHSIFWIPMQFWAVPILAAALLLIVSALVKGG